MLCVVEGFSTIFICSLCVTLGPPKKRYRVDKSKRGAKVRLVRVKENFRQPKSRGSSVGNFVVHKKRQNVSGASSGGKGFVHTMFQHTLQHTDT